MNRFDWPHLDWILDVRDPQVVVVGREEARGPAPARVSSTEDNGEVPGEDPEVRRWDPEAPCRYDE
jgi:hypothetical protein